MEVIKCCKVNIISSCRVCYNIVFFGDNIKWNIGLWSRIKNLNSKIWKERIL